MFVCVCKGIRESDVRQLGQAGITCPKALASSLGIDDKNNCCGRCLKNVSELVNIAAGEHSRTSFPVGTQ